MSETLIATEAWASPEATLSWRERRRLRRRSRPMYKRADRSILRAVITVLIPLPGIAAAGYLYLNGDVLTAAKVGGVAGAVALLLSPLALWWSVSGLRRGTRFIITGVICGALSGLGTVGLATAIYGAAVGWLLLTGEPLPEPFQNITPPIPEGVR